MDSRVSEFRSLFTRFAERSDVMQRLDPDWEEQVHDFLKGEYEDGQ
jgi:hypothetical protein